MQAYGQPSAVPAQQQQPQHEGEEAGGDKKVANMAKKFGGHVATAATWGFGATCKFEKWVIYSIYHSNFTLFSGFASCQCYFLIVFFFF
jgi:hypothetical protein